MEQKTEFEILEELRNAVELRVRKDVIDDFLYSDELDKALADYMRQYPWIHIEWENGEIVVAKGTSNEDDVIRHPICDRLAEMADEANDGEFGDSALLDMRKAYEKLEKTAKESLAKINAECARRGI